MKKLTAVVIGYGCRGAQYTKYACDHPDELQVVAVAEPLAERCDSAKRTHHLTDEQIYNDWKEVASLPKMADFAIIATQDNMHFEPAMAMIEKGYHLLLEKPMAPTPWECKQITEAAERKGVKIIVGHVLRFTKYWMTVKDILDQGMIGNIISVMHVEEVGNVHQSHSFVRGNWRNSKESTPMIVAKSCHDTDLIQWLIGRECVSVQSYGSLTYFKKDNKPEGAPDYCMDGCPHADNCYYYAPHVYGNPERHQWFRRIVVDKVEDPTNEEIMEALKEGPYGRCVFVCDNDVVDHQVVNMEFEGGATVSFSMNAFNKGGREIHIFGTKGELIGNMDDGTIRLYSFETEQYTDMDVENLGTTINSGHGGGDTGIMIDLLKHFNDEIPSKSISSIRTSYMNHLIAFAAEEARIHRTVIDLQKYAEEI